MISEALIPHESLNILGRSYYLLTFFTERVRLLVELVYIFFFLYSVFLLKKKMAASTGGKAKYIIGALIGSFGISYLFDKLISDNKIFGGKFSSSSLDRLSS